MCKLENSSQFLTTLSTLHSDCWPEGSVLTYGRGKWYEVGGR